MTRRDENDTRTNIKPPRNPCGDWNKARKDVRIRLRYNYESGRALASPGYKPLFLSRYRGNSDEKKDVHRHAACGRARVQAGHTDQEHGQAGRAVWGQIPYNRLSAVELLQFGHRRCGRAYAVSAAGAERVSGLGPAVGSGQNQRRRVRAAALCQG